MLMPKWLASSLRFKVAGAALCTTFIALVLSYAMSAWQDSRTMRADAVSHQRAVAEMLASNLSASLVFNDPASAATLLKSIQRIPSVQYAYVLTSRGTLFAASKAGLAPPPGDRGGRLERTETLIDRGVLRVRAPVDVDAEQVGQLVVVSSLAGLHQALVQQAIVAGALFAAAMAVALLAGVWLVGLAIDPVHRLSAAITAVRGGGDFSQRVQRKTSDELGRLTDDFNALFQQLGENDDALKRSLSDLIKARDEADAANVAKSQFLANMSHEIRTPLNGVLGMVQVMELGELPDEQRERLETIRESGDTLLQVLNDVLDFSKIEARKLEINPVEFDVEDLVAGVISTYAESAAKKGLALTSAMAPSAAGVWFGDAVRVRQILMNLVSNAIKFTDRGSITLEVAGSESGLSFVVVDTGIGIAEAEAPKLFNKFSQVDDSATRRFGGTGLGLAICRELAELMGGEIGVQSLPGAGSRFRVSLPLRKRSEARRAAPARPAPAAARLDRPADRPVRILAAEDNPTNQRVLAALLDSLGVDLTIVVNGRQAVEAWRSDAFDLILMDIQMPEMGGVAASQLIRAAEAELGLEPIPIIAVSANAMSHQVEEYLKAGMTAHVAKPIDFRALCSVINDVLAAPEGVAAHPEGRISAA